jgi:hypothetical protein
MTTTRIESRPESRINLASPGFRLHPRSLGILLLFATPLLLSLATLPLVASAQNTTQQGAPLDPPGRVGRISLTEGAVSLAPADSDGRPGNDSWTAASLNRPLTRGDKLWTGPRARSELHIGSTAVRMSEQTSLDFLALDDDVTQLRLAQGSLKLRVRTLFEGQRLEVNTPNLAFVITQPGDYRLDVNPASDVTRVVAQSGGGVMYGDNGAQVDLGSRQQANYSGTQLTPAAPGAAQQDGFDAWAAARDRREDRSVSARYVPRETIGYQELDHYGDWRQDPTYGAVWQPRAVAANWAPYRAGHWSWISPWGWTWVDDAPWGFAPFHYGRWTQIGPRWSWVPGRLAARPVYAPALVAFVGGNNSGKGGGVNWNISISSGGPARPGLGWFPLAPGEAYRPAYRASPRYVTQVNQNIVVNNTVNVTNIYRYQRQPAAVTAASREDFVRGRPLHGGSQQVLSAVDLNRAQVVREHSALPQRPERNERERPRPVATAALPPAALAARPVVGSRDERRQERRADKQPDERNAEIRGEKRGENRDVGQPGRPENRLNGGDDARRAGRPDNNDRNERNGRTAPPVPAPPAAVGLMGAQPPTIKPVPVTPPNAPAARSPAIDRSAQEAEQRARREQPQLPREQQRQQGEAARQHDGQRQATEAAPGQRALREPQKNSNTPPTAAQAPAGPDRHAAEQAQQLQRDQQRQQSEAAQGQRAQREQTQKQQTSDQAAQAQQQLQRAQQDQQRQAREQQQKQASQQQAQQQQRDQQQRQQNEAAQGQRAQREQAQKQQASDQAAQAQQQQQRAQQDQQRQAQQHEQARQQQAQQQVAAQAQAQQQQQQQQQRAQQDQQRQAREQPKPLPQEQQRASDPERQKKRRADAANAAGNPQPDGEPNRNR